MGSSRDHSYLLSNRLGYRIWICQHLSDYTGTLSGRNETEEGNMKLNHTIYSHLFTLLIS